MSKKYLKIISFLSALVILCAACILPMSAATVSEAADGNSVPTGYAFGKIFYGGADVAEKSPALPVTKDYKDIKLYVGGMPFGVKFLTAGVLVVGFNEKITSGGKNPARAAGLRVNDVILSVNGKEILGAAELNDAIENCGGKALRIRFSREGREYECNLTPSYYEAEKRYTAGIYARDSGAGIGTVTFISPESRAFGGLGHGICDGDTGSLIPMQRGSVVGVKINGIVKGLSGTPGEVKGYFNSGKTGTLLSNTDCGVYGVFAELPKEIHGAPVSIGTRDEIKEGRAYVYTMLDSKKVERYEIKISEIQRDATGNKCFSVKVVDKNLIAKTGGIVQGMSGSPIIQNGKLVGAVTHVLINDPTSGYGIFIENMLGAAQMPMAKAS